MRRRTLHLLSAATAALVAASAAFFVTTANAEVDHAACRPDGLYPTPGVTVPYCNVYDTNGRENLGADHGRRIIGYFTSWRTGKNGAPAYLASGRRDLKIYGIGRQVFGVRKAFAAESYLQTGESVPLGTCRCWNAIPADRAAELQSSLVSWWQSRQR